MPATTTVPPRRTICSAEVDRGGCARGDDRAVDAATVGQVAHGVVRVVARPGR